LFGHDLEVTLIVMCAVNLRTDSGSAVGTGQDDFPVEKPCFQGEKIFVESYSRPIDR